MVYKRIMWMLLLTALAAPDDSTPAEGPLGPEPVLELATEDLKALRQARGAQVVSIAAPTLLVAGAFVTGKIVSEPDSGRQVLAVALMIAGGAGMVLAPNHFQSKAIRSRSLLKQQGLQVARTPPVVVPVLTVTAVAVVGFNTFAGSNEGDNTVAGLLVGLGLYGAAVGVPTLQLDLNRRARQNAGWLGVAPILQRDTRGLSVVGRW